MFLNNRDVIDFTIKTKKLLQEKQYFIWSQKFEKALHISYMPGELLGSIRLCFLELQNTDIPSEIGIKNEIDSAVKVLNKTLHLE